MHGEDKKIRHLASLFGITRQASWCRSGTLATDFFYPDRTPMKDTYNLIPCPQNQKGKKFIHKLRSGSEVIKLLSWAWNFSCSVVGILTFMNKKNSIISLPEPKKVLNFLIFLFLWAFKISCSAELSMKKSFITAGPVHDSRVRTLQKQSTCTATFEDLQVAKQHLWNNESHKNYQMNPTWPINRQDNLRPHSTNITSLFRVHRWACRTCKKRSKLIYQGWVNY